MTRRTQRARGARTHKKHKAPFNFAGLPRELRDLVYKHALVKVKSFPNSEGHPDIQIKNVATKNMKLVSRGFKREAMEAAPKRHHVVVPRANSFSTFEVPQRLHNLTHLEVVVGLGGAMPWVLDRVQDEFQHLAAGKLLFQASNLSKLKSWELNIYIFATAPARSTMSGDSTGWFINLTLGHQTQLLSTMKDDERFTGLHVYTSSKVWDPMESTWMLNSNARTELMMSYSRETDK